MVFRTSLADVLDYNESRQADAFSVQKILVDAAWVDTDTLLKQLVISVASSALSTHSVDRIEAIFTIAVAGFWIEDLIDAASVAFGLVAVLYLYGGSAVEAVL